MKYAPSRCLIIILMILSFWGCVPEGNEELDELKAGFEAPPLEARPRALWDWVDGKFDLEEITYEMEEAVRIGMGGFDIWDVRSVVDEGNIMNAGPPFMSYEALDGIVHAIREAKRLGLDLGLVISSGWNAGGIWTRAEHQAMGIFSWDTTVQGPGEIIMPLGYPQLPDLYGTENRQLKVIIKRDRDGVPLFSQDIGVIAYAVDPTDSLLITTQVEDVSSRVRDGNLIWRVPPGEWKVVRYVCANTGQPMISSSPNSVGPMIDHFSAEATDRHLLYIIDKIEEVLREPIGEAGLSYLYTDSYEIEGNLWTPNMTEEFQDRMRYNMVPYLPALEGYTISDPLTTSRFMYDYRKVLSDLIIENHYQLAKTISENYMLDFVAEAGGPGPPLHNCPFESLKSSGSLSFPRGEFWHIPENTDFWRSMSPERKHHYLYENQVIKVNYTSHQKGLFCVDTGV
jgi:hypothetical protein